ncbi:GreA/GreB family elongation factor [Candidatus Dojkabacteria bacterium]|nr:GreA/GreB family elongation factor [Candidatus Dojkabacteria bacterium]
MDNQVFLFPQTISSIKKRIKDLKKDFELEDGQDPTGSNTRLLDPGRVSLFEEISQLDSLVNTVKVLPTPKQNDKAQKGHFIEVEDSAGRELQFHLCSEYDVKYHSGFSGISGRLLSADSPLGGIFIGKKVDENIKYGQQVFRIKKIRVSKYFEI